MSVEDSGFQDEIFRIDVNHVDTATMQADIDAIWSKIPENGRYLENGQPPSAAASPYEARQAARAGVVETIIISFVGALAKDAATALWKEVIWPALKRKYGADIKEV